MDLSRYIDIIRFQSGLWKTLDETDVQKKLEAFWIVEEFGTPALIPHLIDSLKEEKMVLREAAIRTIRTLFSTMVHKRNLYESLKYCPIQKADFSFYKEHFSEDDYLILLAIGSMNGNGYTRQEAVVHLSQSQNPKAIPFLMYRLADWVINVRNKAWSGLENFLSPQYATHFVGNLALLDWLQKVQRTDLSGIVREIETFLLVENRTVVFSTLRQYDDKSRILLVKKLSARFGLLAHEINPVLKDRNPLVRMQAIAHFDNLSDAQIDLLLQDNSGKVRFKTILALIDRNGFEPIARFYLTDNSHMVRMLAKYALKDQNIDLAQFYNQCLLDNTRLEGALAGLIESNGKFFRDNVRPFLNHHKISVKKQAFKTFYSLDWEQSTAFALEHLDHELPAIRNMMAEYLSYDPRPEVIEKARLLYETGDFDRKRIAIKLFAKIGGWSILADLMLATLNEDEAIRHIAGQALGIWKRRAVNLFSRPNPADLERARSIWGLAYEIHESKNFFEKNPVNGIDFYLE